MPEAERRYLYVPAEHPSPSPGVSVAWLVHDVPGDPKGYTGPYRSLANAEDVGSPYYDDHGRERRILRWTGPSDLLAIAQRRHAPWLLADPADGEGTVECVWRTGDPVPAAVAP